MTSPQRMVVANGTVVDGFGGVPFVGDVIVSDGLIEGIVAAGARPEGGYGAQVIDVSGLIVSPGFVDIHCHSDLSRFAYPGNESRTTQGITTEVVGNCGMSAAPTGGDAAAFAAAIATIDVTPETPRPWSTVAEWLDAMDRAPSATNVAALVGHGSARHTALHDKISSGDADDVAAIVHEVSAALDAGCVGASLGLMYAPGETAHPDELRAVGAAVARAGGLLAAHMRNYDASALAGSVDEVVAAAGEARVQISHLRATSTERGFADTLARIEDLRNRTDIAADSYPYIAGHTTLIQLLPSAVRAGGATAALAFGEDRGALASLLEGAGWRADQITIMKARRTPEAVGTSPASQHEPWKWLAELLLDNDALVDVAVESGVWADVDMALGTDWVTIGSDGTALSHTHASSAPHPRSWGAFPASFRRMRENGVTLASAIRRMSVASAERVNIPSGLSKGLPADITVFAEETLGSRASFAQPAQPATGIHHVFVNGVAALLDGVPTTARPGRLRRAGEAA
ncbi:N-acyl-D-amino-acid deacylase family protein [Microbacterium saperdae]